MAHLKPENVILRALILKNAATPQGFSFADIDGLTARTNADKALDRMRAKGLIFKAKAPSPMLRYFSTAQAAHAHMLAHGKDAPDQTPKVMANTQRLPAVRVRQPVEITYAPDCKYTRGTTPPQRNQVVVHSFVHGGMGAM
jgi:hypothetical protein